LAEVSLLLAIEALAFVHKARAFVCGHSLGAGTARRGIHGVRIFFSTFAVEPLLPPI